MSIWDLGISRLENALEAGLEIVIGIPRTFSCVELSVGD
jgi:hypothetical protein